jgi:hypothetical protein
MHIDTENPEVQRACFHFLRLDRGNLSQAESSRIAKEIVVAALGYMIAASPSDDGESRTTLSG